MEADSVVNATDVFSCYSSMAFSGVSVNEFVFIYVCVCIYKKETLHTYVNPLLIEFEQLDSTTNDTVSIEEYQTTFNLIGDFFFF